MHLHMNQKNSSYLAVRDAPHIARRHYKRWIFVSILMFVLINSAVIPFVVYDVDRKWSFVYFGLWGLSMIILIFIALQSHRQLVKRLEASDYKLCPKCGYQLKGLAGKTCCPECGLELDVEEVESQWRRYRAARPMPFR